jgi:hypothetical protein
MAIKIFEKYGPRANPADADYPYGSIKNESVPGANDGTPLEAAWANDYAGADAALFAEAGIVPNGRPDTVVDSQRLDAMMHIVTFKIDNITGFYQKSPNINGTTAVLSSWHAGWAATLARPYGGGLFVWDAAGNKADHDGGSIIDPDIQFTNVAAYLSASGSGNGVWRRIYDELYISYFGAKLNGSDDDTASAQATLAASNGTRVVFDKGDALITATLSLDDLNFADIRFESGARILAGVNGLTVFQSTVNAWGVKIFDADIRGNGFTGVLAFDMVRLEQLGAGIFRPVLRDLDGGIFLRSLCTGCHIDDPDIQNTDKPIRVLDGSGGIKINHPRIDSFGLIGIHLQPAGSFPNVGVEITGGYIQNGGEGIRDEGGVATQILGTYFETCTVADIKFDTARFATVRGTNHTSTGNVGVFARDSDGIRVLNPFMSSGGRTVGLFDFDASNTNCYADYDIGADAENTPLGNTAGIGKIATQEAGTFTPVVEGTSAAGVGTYTIQLGRYRRIGDTIHVRIKVAWTAHTGNGNLVIQGLPAVGTIAATERHPILASSFAFTGPVVAAGFTGSGTELAVYNYANSGTVTLISLPSAGSIEINTTFTLV